MGEDVKIDINKSGERVRIGFIRFRIRIGLLRTWQ
jgi:hypothetical protein